MRPPAFACGTIENMTVLVSGATGRIGGAVFRRLSEQGVDVRGGTRRPDTAGLPDGTAVAFDLGDPATFGPALNGAQRVFLYAASEELGPFFDAARAAGGPHVVLLSSSSVVDDDAGSNPIAQHHQHLEDAIAASGLPHTFLRPGYFASNALRWARSVRANRSVSLAYPEAVLDPTHELDIADVAVAALSGDDLIGRAPVLTGPENLTQRQQVQTIGSALGEPVDLVELTPEAARDQMAQAMPLPTVETLLRLLAGAVGRNSELTDEVQAITGHPPRPFAGWAREHIADFA